MSSIVSFTCGQPFDEAHGETLGPRVGVVLTLEKAQLLLDHHCPDVQCLSLEYVKRGFNNRTYVLRLSNGSDLVVRLGGRFWTKQKTRNEVACLVYVRYHCPRVPVPKVFFYSCDCKLIGAEYICMEKMPGSPLDERWPEMSAAQRHCVLEQLAEHLADIKQLHFDEIGNLGFQSAPELPKGLPEVKDILVDQCFDLCSGPFSSYHDYVRSQIEDSLQHLIKHPFFKPLCHFMPRMQTLLQDCFLPNPCPSKSNELTNALFPKGPFVMTHYDLEPRNILVNNEHQVTAILDWEFSGAYPQDEEWMTSFDFLRANSAESIMGTYNAECPTSDLEDLRNSFLCKLESLGVFTPRTEPFLHFQRAELFVLKDELAPWYLREVEENVPQEAYQQRTNAAATVERILQKYDL